MAKLPVVAIIGRPNTGKSTLFNRFVGSRRAIVSDTPGTTRDHVMERVEWDDMDFLLLDTGGMGGGSVDTDFEEDVSAQSTVALSSADLILFTVNAKEPMTASDEAVIEVLRKRKKNHVPVIVVATKCDNPETAEQAGMEYQALGVADDVIPISAVHNVGVADLEKAIVKHLKALHFEKKKKEDGTEARLPRIALVGKPNVGKSSLVNAFMSEPQRKLSSRIVSDIPGTTRDSSDTIIKNEEKEYVFVDTAGLRRKSRVDEDLEYYSNMRSIQAIEDSDVVVLMLDAQDVISKQDKRIASLAVEAGKGLILFVNKADALTTEEKEEKETEVRASLPFCRYAQILFGSAKTRDGILKLFPLIESIQRNRVRRIPQKELMRWYQDAISRVPSQVLGKSKFITQAEELPPTFVLFVKNAKKVDVSQLRALENNMRSTFAFEGTPIKWITKDPLD